MKRQDRSFVPQQDIARARMRLPWRGSTLIIAVFLAVTILPAFAAHLLTSSDAQVVRTFEAWNGCVYVVRPGDDLFRIGLRYGVSYVYLAQLNGIPNPNYIYAGQVLSVPCTPYSPYYPYYPPYPRPPPPYVPTGCKPPVSYTVKPGDNLFRIAINYGSTIVWIRNANHLWGRVLRPGMVLSVPCPGAVKYRPVPTITPGTPSIITATPPRPPNSVLIQNKRFRPPTLTVKPGTVVTWLNTDSAGNAYTVVSGTPQDPTNLFASPPIPPGGSFQFRFDGLGLYQYYSGTFPEMSGAIEVKP